jgi:hypothetical protein
VRLAQLVEALRHKPGGRGFDSLLTSSFRPHYGFGVTACNRNEYQGFLLGSRLRVYLPPSSGADRPEIVGDSTSWIRKGLSRPVWGLLFLLFYGAEYFTDKRIVAQFTQRNPHVL